LILSLDSKNRTKEQPKNRTKELIYMQKKIMLLGSGELGKELVISLKRLGQYVIAVDNYPPCARHAGG
jgi:formate-dependent phosphoribosylglycinamide formyltransferase (GAR transformylase)